MRLFLLLAFVLVPLAGCAAQPGPAPEASAIPSASTQLVLVTTPSWNATDGTLRTFERDARGSGGARLWREVGAPTATVVGRSGLGWGRGLHAPEAGVQKREGDGRAPAGAFSLSAAFGYAAGEPTGLPYVQATPSLMCVDDAASAFYTLVVDADAVAPDWTSREQMRRADSLYSLGVVVAHNGPGITDDLVGGASGATPEAGAGSCIFLHVWRGPGSSTAGCTAMPSASLQRVMGWLDARQRPVLVQLPEPEAERLRAVWGLPE